MHEIITPKQIAQYAAQHEAEDRHWHAIYEQSEHVRHLADAIHQSRLLTPPACTECIKRAVQRLHQQYPGLTDELYIAGLNNHPNP